MVAKVLFHYDITSVGAVYDQISKAIRYFDCIPIVVDAVLGFKSGLNRSPVAMPSLDDAITEFDDHNWVFLHQEGDSYLDQLSHPDEPVIYAVGSNKSGFDKSLAELQAVGSVVKLRGTEIVYDYQAIMLALYDRQLFVNGRRLV